MYLYLHALKILSKLNIERTFSNNIWFVSLGVFIPLNCLTSGVIVNKLCKLWKHVRDVKSPHLTRCFHWLSIYGDTVPQTVHFNMENVEGWTIPAGDNLVDHGNDFLSANDLNSVALDDIDGKSSNLYNDVSCRCQLTLSQTHCVFCRSLIKQNGFCILF